MVARHLARRDRRLHAHKLLERAATRARPVAIRKVAAQIRIRVSCMQSQPAHRRLLEMRKVWPGVRYFSNWSSVSALRNAICSDQVSRLRRPASDERMVWQRNPRELESSGYHNVASRLTCHFGLALRSAYTQL